MYNPPGAAAAALARGIAKHEMLNNYLPCCIYNLYRYYLRNHEHRHQYLLYCINEYLLNIMCLYFYPLSYQGFYHMLYLYNIHA